jgi:hypothetical protein
MTFASDPFVGIARRVGGPVPIRHDRKMIWSAIV